jgi:hypothetical protein
MMVSYIYVRFFSLRCIPEREWAKAEEDEEEEELERWEK